MGFTWRSFERYQKIFENDTQRDARFALQPVTISNRGFNMDNSNFNLFEYPLPRLIYKVCRSFKLEETLYGYGLLGGSRSLRGALAELARLRSENLDARQIRVSNIFVGNAASGILDKVIKAVLLLGGVKNEIIFHYPVYPIFNFLILKNGGKPVPIRTTYENKFLPTPEEIEKAITPKTAAVCIVYPCNPTGTTFTDRRPLERIFSLVRKKNLVLIVDEIYQDTMHGEKKHISLLSLVDSLYNIVSLTSLSKDRPGFNELRVGYAVGDPRIINILSLLASGQEWSVPLFVQHLLMVDTCMRIAQRNGNYQHWLSKIGLTISEKEVKQYFSDINNIMGKMERHVRILYDILVDSPMIEKILRPEAGNILFFKIRTAGSFKKIKDFKKILVTRKMVFICKGEFFLVDRDDDCPWFRITISQSLSYALMGIYRLLGFSKNERTKLHMDQLEREIKYDPKNHRLLTSYASILLDLNKYKEATKVLNKISPANDILARYQLYYLKGTLFLKLNKLKLGIRWLKKATKVPILNKQLLPEGETIDEYYYNTELAMYSQTRLYNNIGLVYSLLKEKNKADWYFKKAKDLK